MTGKLVERSSEKGVAQTDNTEVTARNCRYVARRYISLGLRSTSFTAKVMRLDAILELRSLFAFLSPYEQ